MVCPCGCRPGCEEAAVRRRRYIGLGLDVRDSASSVVPRPVEPGDCVEQLRPSFHGYNVSFMQNFQPVLPLHLEGRRAPTDGSLARERFEAAGHLLGPNE